MTTTTSLACERFDVLLTHDGPRDAILPDSGSLAIDTVLENAAPAFAFFGHYRWKNGAVHREFPGTRLIHLAGLTLEHEGSVAEPGCAGILSWDGTAGVFRYLDPEWLRTFTRHNWKHR